MEVLPDDVLTQRLRTAAEKKKRNHDQAKGKSHIFKAGKTVEETKISKNLYYQRDNQ